MPAETQYRGTRSRRLASFGGAVALAGIVLSGHPSWGQMVPGNTRTGADGGATPAAPSPDLSGSAIPTSNGITASGLRGSQDVTTSQDTPANGTDASGDGLPVAAGDAAATSPTGGPVAAIPAVSGTQSPDNRNLLGRINLRQVPIDGLAKLPPPEPLDLGPGIRLGSFVFRPELRQGVGAESQTYADGTHSSRIYSETQIRGTLASDWSRHALTVIGSGTYQANIAGTGATQPTAEIDADLRLDLAERTTADLTASYNFYRELATDPNAVAGAASQATVNVFTGGAALSRDLGRLRGSLAAKAIRTTYGDVLLTDGSTLSQSDRDTLAGDFAARLGYQISGALTPFVEARYRGTSYDHGTDMAGYLRSSNTYTAEAGLAADLGEKLSGEIAAGYVLRNYADSRLPDVDGLALDGTGHWSPRRGTDIALNVATQIEDSTTAGVSGPIAYSIGTAMVRQVRDDIVARLALQYLYRDYQQNDLVPDQQVYTVSTGLSWYLNRYLSLDGNVAFARTLEKGSHDQDVATVDIGLTARR